MVFLEACLNQVGSIGAGAQGDHDFVVCDGNLSGVPNEFVEEGTGLCHLEALSDAQPQHPVQHAGDDGELHIDIDSVFSFLRSFQQVSIARKRIKAGIEGRLGNAYSIFQRHANALADKLSYLGAGFIRAVQDTRTHYHSSGAKRGAF